MTQRERPQPILWKKVPGGGVANPSPGTQSQGVKATPAQKLLTTVGDWAKGVTLVAASGTAAEMAAVGYKPFYIPAGDDSYVHLCLHATAPDTVEIQSLSAHPPRHGRGSTVLKKLCDLADVLEVTLWLNAIPFGDHRPRMSVEKLKEWYARFGFFQVKTVPFGWVNSTHRRDGVRLDQVMIRNPKVSD